MPGVTVAGLPMLGFPVKYFGALVAPGLDSVTLTRYGVPLVRPVMSHEDAGGAVVHVFVVPPAVAEAV